MLRLHILPITLQSHPSKVQERDTRYFSRGSRRWAKGFRHVFYTSSFINFVAITNLKLVCGEMAIVCLAASSECLLEFLTG